jgi:hypothetical protein
MHKYRFTVIIPLEYHRGQIEDCLKGWITNQVYPQDQYEILAAAHGPSLSNQARSFLKEVLRSHDKLLLYDKPHDMALCAKAALDAKGELLVFTESHCIPNPNVLSVAEQEMQTHSEWAGLCAKGLPIAHNRLSIVEAEMYVADIEHGLMVHSWRKVLDQFFVVRKERYLETGGFVPELAHFAEWHLAAHMHQKGFLVGYAPDVQYWHYYSGDFQELLEFSNDFTHGEMIYKSGFKDDPCQTYFPEPNEWSSRFKWIPRLAKPASILAGQAHARSATSILSPVEFFLHLYLLLIWQIRLYAGINLRLLLSNLRFHIARTALQIGNFFNIGKNMLNTLFLQLVDASIRLERVKFVRQWLQHPHNETVPLLAAKIHWQPDATLENIHVLGFHPMEEWNGSKFRWSEPVAMIEFSLQPGKYRFTMDWLPIRLIKNLVVYLDEKPLTLTRTDHQAAGAFDISSSLPVRFSWTCESFTHYTFDRRMLGVPLKSLTWTRMDYGET